MTAPKITPMPLSRLAELLDAYGSDAARWPESERDAALALVRRDAEARALVEQASTLDALLDVAQAPPDMPAALRARVLEIPVRHPRETARRGRFFGLRWSLLALVPCVLGFVSGTLFTDVSSVSSMTDNDDDAWNEIATVAMPSDMLDEDAP